MGEQTDEVFDSAYELYQEIRDNRGLHLRYGDGRDDVLYDELRNLMGCDDQKIADFLQKENKSSDWLLRHFLRLAAPFASMYTDIWDFLASEKAPKVTEDLRVRFGFDGDDITEVDMEQFREWAETARRVSVGVNVSYWSDEAVKELFDLKACVDVEADQYGSEYRRGEPYELPVIKTHHGDDFELYLRSIRNLFQHAIDDLAQKDDSHYSAFGAEEPEMPLVNLTDLLPGWEPILRNHQTVSEGDRRQAEQYFRDNIEPKLEKKNIISSLNYQSPLDILRLPFWEHRWHTYEIWMTVQSLQALDSYDPQVRVNDGRIPIDGRDEAVVADLERVKEGQACVVSELKTPHKTEEREAIQPDLSICRTTESDENRKPVTTEQLGKESRVVIIEYKQRENLSPSHAEDRAELYLDASPEAAGLVMVNYDEPADVNFPDRAKLIGNVRPGSPEVRKYHESVQEYINELELFGPLNQWTVLIDVSGSMGDVFTEPDVKDALLKLLEIGGPDLEMYTFNNGLTQEPRASARDIELGLQTGGGTDVKTAIEEIYNLHDGKENLLVITDGGYQDLGPLPEEVKNKQECLPQELPSELDKLMEPK